jgi:hypothetical protein
MITHDDPPLYFLNPAAKPLQAVSKAFLAIWRTSGSVLSTR